MYSGVLFIASFLTVPMAAILSDWLREGSQAVVDDRRSKDLLRFWLRPVWVSSDAHRYYRVVQINGATTFEGSHFLLTSSKRLNHVP